MLKRVQMQDWNADFAYAPPLRDAVINTDEVISARETDSRGSGPWTSIRFRDGSEMTIRGYPEDLLPPAGGG